MNITYENLMWKKPVGHTLVPNESFWYKIAHCATRKCSASMFTRVVQYPIP